MVLSVHTKVATYATAKNGHEGIWAVNVKIHVFLTSELAGGEWSSSIPGRFTPGTHWIGGWVDLRAGVDDVEKRKFLILLGLEFRPIGRPARSQLQLLRLGVHLSSVVQATSTVRLRKA
jgi:hypothetical protein